MRTSFARPHQRGGVANMATCAVDGFKLIVRRPSLHPTPARKRAPTLPLQGRVRPSVGRGRCPQFTENDFEEPA